MQLHKINCIYKIVASAMHEMLPLIKVTYVQTIFEDLEPLYICDLESPSSISCILWPWPMIKCCGKNIIWKLIIPPCCGWLCGLHFQLMCAIWLHMHNLRILTRFAGYLTTTWLQKLNVQKCCYNDFLQESLTHAHFHSHYLMTVIRSQGWMILNTYI